jgi:GNAT superfamily N-acetyltransferase
LRGSSHVVLARDGARVVGFVTAISDGVLSAYIPLLEVRPEYQRQGIGTELVRRLLDVLRGLYMVDLVCDEDVVPFYERLGSSASMLGWVCATGTPFELRAGTGVPNGKGLTPAFRRTSRTARV